MGGTSKEFSLLLIIILAMSSLIIVESACAQSSTPIPHPLKPDLSIEVTNSSYYVPVKYSVDPSSGQEIANTTYYSGYVDALNVTIKIKTSLLPCPLDLMNIMVSNISLNLNCIILLTGRPLHTTLMV
jgi:hypothetical protein